jgi:flagellar hook-associated protein 1 FlgK
MPNTFFGLNIGTLGLYAANANLNVTANNISNEQTKGYSRQEAKQQATNAIRVYQKYGTIGTGVEVTEINRVHDEYYDEKYQKNQSRLGDNETKNYYMLQIEDYFNEATIDGFTESYSNVYKALEELQKNPSDFTTRVSYLNEAQALMDFFQQIKTDMGLVQQDLNAEINNNVEKINSIAAEIASLNKQINVVELTGANANELRDNRTLLLDDLSKIAQVTTEEKTFDNGKSEFRVKLGGNTLIDNYDYYTLKVVSRTDKADNEDMAGLYDIEWSYGTEFNPVKEGIEGSLNALLMVRDGNNGTAEANPVSYDIKYKGVPYYIDEVNTFLKTFTDKFNEIHAQGVNLKGDSTATIPLFKVSDLGVYSINHELIDNPDLMATSKNPEDGKSQYDLVSELLGTKNKEDYEGGTASQFLQSLVTEIAVDTRKTKNLTENYTKMQTSIQNQRLSVMGVDTDEEAMNLVKFKEAYNLSSKVISVMNEIYSKLINETGV